MLTLIQLLAGGGEAADSVTLPYELRTRSRLRVTLDSGRDAALLIGRGLVLRDGDRLAAADGSVVRVRAAPETVSTALCNDPLLLARACYHLGNRHVAVQVDAGWLRYRHDHVLDTMLRGLGLAVRVHEAPFEPESGAYGGHAGQAHHAH